MNQCAQIKFVTTHKPSAIIMQLLAYVCIRAITRSFEELIATLIVFIFLKKYALSRFYR